MDGIQFEMPTGPDYLPVCLCDCDQTAPGLLTQECGKHRAIKLASLAREGLPLLLNVKRPDGTIVSVEIE